MARPARQGAGSRFGGRATGGRVGGGRMAKTTGLRGGYKAVTGGSRNSGPPPKGASRFPAIKSKTTTGAYGRGARGVAGSGVRAVRAKAARKAW